MYLIGQASDIHYLKKQNKLQTIILGGYKFNSNYKIMAHSDGDLILHAIANAILGSIQQKDIGHYFNDKDIKNKNMDSKIILNHALFSLKKAKAKIINIDMTIFCENIILEPHKENIVKSLSSLLNTKLINLKATRFERKTGKIQCDVVLLVEKKEK